MRSRPVPAAIAAALARRTSRFREVGIPLYLPAFGDRFETVPEDNDEDDHVVDASGFTVGGDDDEDDDYGL